MLNLQFRSRCSMLSKHSEEHLGFEVYSRTASWLRHDRLRNGGLVTDCPYFCWWDLLVVPSATAIQWPSELVYHRRWRSGDHWKHMRVVLGRSAHVGSPWRHSLVCHHPERCGYETKLLWSQQLRIRRGAAGLAQDLSLPRSKALGSTRLRHGGAFLADRHFEPGVHAAMAEELRELWGFFAL